MAIFTRNSVAYDSNGNQVTANVPRFSCNGLFVEEGTTNLIPSTKQTFVTGFTAYSGEGITVSDYDVYIPELGKTVTAKRITGDGKGTSTYKYFTSIYNYAIGNIITTSIYGMVLSGNAHLVSNIAAGNTIYFNNTMQRLSATSNAATSSGTTQLSFVTNNATDVLDIVVYRPQQELKSHATSFTDSTRAAESLTIPANAFSKDEGGIELAFKLDTLIKGLTVFYATNSGETFEFYINPFGSCVWIYNSANSNIVGSGVFSVNTIKIALFWSKAKSIKCAYVNGKIIGTQSFNGCPNSFNPSFFNVANATSGDSLQLKYLRCSNSYHESTKIISDSALYNLPVEADTTYKMDLQNNIGAQASPMCRIGGNGTVSTSRQGTGRRSISIIGTEKTQVDSIRKSFVSVDISALSRVSTVRQGKGVRNTVISGVGTVNMIEPLITADLNVQERKGETEVEGVPLIGNTVRIVAKFHTFTGPLADPENITLAFFDSADKQIGTTIDITSANRLSAGIYEYFYTIPTGYGRIWYEFAGMQQNTRQAVSGKFECLTVQQYNGRYR